MRRKIIKKEHWKSDEVLERHEDVINLSFLLSIYNSLNCLIIKYNILQEPADINALLFIANIPGCNNEDNGPRLKADNTCDRTKKCWLWPEKDPEEAGRDEMLVSGRGFDAWLCIK